MSGNIARLLSESQKVAIVDCDPQGNTSSWFLTESPAHELADVLQGNVEVKAALVDITDNLSILPTFSLDGLLKQYAETRLNAEPFIFEELGKVQFNKIACNLVNKSFRRHADFVDALKRLDYELFLILQDTHLAECQIHHQPLLQYDSKSRALLELKRLAESIARDSRAISPLAASRFRREYDSL